MQAVLGGGLEGVAILEKDKAGDVLVTWSYPGLDKDLADVVVERSHLRSESGPPLPFIWSKYKTVWLHVHTTSNPTGHTFGALPQVAAVALVLVTKTFNPEKWAALSGLLASVYTASGSPVKVLECYLSVFTKGKVDAAAYGTFVDSDHDVRRAYLVTSVKDITNLFGIETIILWSAILMKKRIVVYCDNLALLLKIIRGLPLFVWHRQDWDILRPHTNMTDTQLEELHTAGIYIAGFTDPAIKLKKDYYDVLVDVDTRTISVAEEAASDFKMGAFHKELATWLVQSCENPDIPAQSVIKDLAVKTKDLVAKLQLLRVEDAEGNKRVTLENLTSRRLPPHMDRFLFAVAVAEKLA